MMQKRVPCSFILEVDGIEYPIYETYIGDENFVSLLKNRVKNIKIFENRREKWEAIIFNERKVSILIMSKNVVPTPERLKRFIMMEMAKVI
jgi:hypothetical protein